MEVLGVIGFYKGIRVDGVWGFVLDDCSTDSVSHIGLVAALQDFFEVLSLFRVLTSPVLLLILYSGLKGAMGGLGG